MIKKLLAVFFKTKPKPSIKLEQSKHNPRGVLRRIVHHNVLKRHFNHSEHPSEAAVHKMTNWQRIQWMKAGCPRDQKSITEFLNLEKPGHRLKPTPEQMKAVAEFLKKR